MYKLGLGGFILSIGVGIVFDNVGAGLIAAGATVIAVGILEYLEPAKPTKGH